MKCLFFISVLKFDLNFLDESPAKQQTKKIVSNFLQFNQSYKCLEETAKLVNSTPGIQYKIPTTIYRIKKLINPLFATQFYLKCPKCNTYTTTTSNEVPCDCCTVLLKRVNSIYFVYLPFTVQLERIIVRHFEDIVLYKESFNDNSEVIADVHDGIEFKRSQHKYKDSFVLPLTVNADGIKVFNSTTKSIWPIQVYLNFLRPQIRYIPKNVLVVALNDGKPDMRAFFYPFLNELKAIKDQGGLNIEKNGNTINFLPLIISCTADLPAKADIQGTVGHSGYFGCGYCYHKGDLIKKDSKSKSVVRYVARDSLIRTNSDTLNTYRKLKSEPIHGIKSVSCMVAASDFDLINGFSLDYMHCVLLGVMRKLIDLWVSPCNHAEPYYISKKRQVVLSNRIVSIKPLCEITRKPRSLFDRKDFKANEFRTLLLYILRYSLIDLLPMRYIIHFQLFSSAVYMLLEERVTEENIGIAESRLKKFADKFEDFYGKHNVTMNVHLLHHLANSVRHLGPLWAQSAFAFETNNGVIVRLNNAKKDILHNISWKYAIKSALTEQFKTIDREITFGGKTTIRVESENISRVLKNELEIDSNIISIYSHVSFGGIKITSLHSKVISTADYFVKLATGEMGAINYFFVEENIGYALIEMFNVESTNDHLMEVESKNIFQIFHIKQIKEKILYMKIGEYKIACKIPNRFEKT